MIAADLKTYDYFTFGEKNAYGQKKLNEEVKGQIKMAINISSQSVQDNVNYADCNYVGLTMANVDDSYVIKYGTEKLKVLYVNPRGRYKVVYLKKI